MDHRKGLQPASAASCSQPRNSACTFPCWLNPMYFSVSAWLRCTSFIPVGPICSFSRDAPEPIGACLAKSHKCEVESEKRRQRLNKHKQVTSPNILGYTKLLQSFQWALQQLPEILGPSEWTDRPKASAKSTPGTPSVTWPSQTGASKAWSTGSDQFESVWVSTWLHRTTRFVLRIQCKRDFRGETVQITNPYHKSANDDSDLW